MIKKLLLTLSMASLFGVAVKAQTIQPCGTSEVYLKQLGLHPEIATKEAQLNEYIRAKLATMDISRFAKITDDGTVNYDIPLVFHIIHDYGNEYLTDANIVQCVSDINKMYHKQNADTAEVIAAYKGFINNSNQRYIGKANITWHLATIGPDGKPTNGITRRQSYLTKNAGDQAKFDLWAPSSYMNVWVINAMPNQGNAAAYAYQPPTADAIPYYDGVISLYNYVNSFNTISHELGHELNLAHPWGNTNNPGVACGDDDVDDTPPTKGHYPSTGCNYANTADTGIWDTSCINTTRIMAKLRLDSISSGSGLAIQSDTSTINGITFSSRTVTWLDSVSFYPSAPIGSSYTIALTKSNVVINTKTVVSTVKNTVQTVGLNFRVPGGGDKDSLAVYKLRFSQNPGAWKDTVTPGLAAYSHGLKGAILINQPATAQYYNFFYNWRTHYGYFKIYDNDSLVDYPDTTNSQNVMDYTYCSKMFTYGQIQRMRAALTSDVAKRDSLWSPYNLAKTGALLATPAMAPKAAYSIEKGLYVVTNEPTYFMPANGAGQFKLMNRTWQATPTTISWTLSNSATTSTSATTSSFTTQFATPGWATVTMIATNANGSDTFTAAPIVDPVTGSSTGNTSTIYIADPTAVNPIGYYQEFNPGGDLDKWPIFNYYNNRFKWEVVNTAGYYDHTSMRYRSFDDRAYPENLTGDPTGDRDDFFTPGFDLSSLGTNGNINFMMAGAYSTSNPVYMRDTLTIAYSKDNGITWTTIKTMAGAQLQTVGVATKPGTEYSPSYGDWQPVSIDLKNGTTPIRDANVYFRFRYRPYGKQVSGAMMEVANNFYLDRFNISNNPLSINEMVLGERNVAIAPNPTTSNAYVLFKSANAHVNIQVTDITGKVVYTVSQKIDANNARVEIPAASLQVKGMYLVHITGDDNMNQTEKLVVY